MSKYFSILKLNFLTLLCIQLFASAETLLAQDEIAFHISCIPVQVQIGPTSYGLGGLTRSALYLGNLDHIENPNIFNLPDFLFPTSTISDRSTISSVQSGVLGSGIGYLRFSPDGKKIAILTESGMVTLDTENNLSNNWGSNISGWDWSNDGEEIVFISNDMAQGQTLSQINIMSNDGSTTRVLMQSQDSNTFYLDLDLSPDGQYIVFSSFQNNSLEIYKMKRDGTDLHPITTLNSEGLGGLNPRYSRDGSMIAFVSIPLSGPNPYMSIYVMNSDGTNLRTLTDSNFNNLPNPSWANDDQQVIYIYENEVWSNKIDGSDEQLIMKTDGLCKVDNAVWRPGS